MNDPNDTLSSPAFPVTVVVSGIVIGKLNLVSEIIDLYKKAKEMKWGNDLVLTDAFNRPVFLLRGIPFVRP